MKKLINKDTGAEVIGTYECVWGVSQLTNPRRENGEVKYDYAGYTDVDWDSQKTIESPAGHTVFVDEDGEHTTNVGVTDA